LPSAGLVLPLLADPWPTEPLPAVRAAIDAVDEQRLVDSVLGLARRMVVDDGLNSYPEVVDALRAVAEDDWDRPVVIDSLPVGRVLRELAAQDYAMQTALGDPRGLWFVSEQDRSAARRRAQTGRILHAVLTGDWRTVAAALVNGLLSGDQRKEFLAQLGISDPAPKPTGANHVQLIVGPTPPHGPIRADRFDRDM
jgi:hypothetical protein